jgi:regulator of protease activity HflC (stomatin/prohibitin superfamily)
MPILVREVAIVTSITVGLGAVLAMISLLALTVNKEVAQDELMVAVNTMYTGQVRGPFEQGRQNLQVGDSMIHFKRTVIPMPLRVTCYSRDLLQVTLDITVMYQYVQEAIVPTILKAFYDETYMLGMFRSVVAGSSYASCSNFTAEEYYQNRQLAENSLLQNLKIDLDYTLNETVPEFQSEDSTHQPIRITQLQLTNVDFPSAYNNIIQLKLQTQVQQTASLNNRATLLTNANTALISAYQQANILNINGQQTADVILAQANATQQIVVDQWRARALSFQAVQTQLGLTDPVSLLRYWQAELLRVHPRSIVLQ